MNHRVETALDVVRLTHSLGSDYDCNVIGLAGEVIAEEFLGMKKAKRQCKDLDGEVVLHGSAHSVQVKTISALRIRKRGGTTKFRVTAGDVLSRVVVILIFPASGRFALLYDGPAEDVGKVETVNGIERRGIRISDLHSDKAVLDALVKRCQSDD